MQHFNPYAVGNNSATQQLGALLGPHNDQLNRLGQLGHHVVLGCVSCNSADNECCSEQDPRVMQRYNTTLE